VRTIRASGSHRIWCTFRIAGNQNWLGMIFPQNRYPLFGIMPYERFASLPTSLTRLGCRGMPRMMHDMTVAARNVLAHTRTMSRGMLHCLIYLDSGGRRRLGLDCWGRAVGAGRARGLSGHRRAGDQAGRRTSSTWCSPFSRRRGFGADCRRDAIP
jgi:hypothetical protein